MLLKKAYFRRDSVSSQLTVKEKFPEDSRPRERLYRYGESHLSDHELLAIILRTGTRELNVIDLSLKLLAKFENLYNLKQASIEELMAIPGIGKVKAIELCATFELGSRVQRAKQGKYGVITSSEDAGDYLLDEMKGLEQEHVIALYLNTKNEVIKQETLFIGSLNSAISHPREIFKGAVRVAAARIVLAHNHPSGNPEPSQADYNFTKRLVECGELMGIDILDHFVIGETSFISLKEYGWI